MIKLKELILKQKKINQFSTEFYKLVELKNNLQKIEDEYLQTEDLTLVPFYVMDKKRMELYEYELNIRVEKIKKPEDILLNKTGKKHIKDIPKEIILRHNVCYIQTEDGTIEKDRILNYVKYILTNLNNNKDITQNFKKYDENNLLFEVY